MHLTNPHYTNITSPLLQFPRSDLPTTWAFLKSTCLVGLFHDAASAAEFMSDNSECKTSEDLGSLSCQTDSDQLNITTEFPTWDAGGRGGGKDSSSPAQSVGPCKPHTLTMLQQSLRSTGRPLPTTNGTDNVERHLQQRIRQRNMALRHSGNLTFNFHAIPEFMKDVLYQYRTRCIYCTSYIRFILSI